MANPFWWGPPAQGNSQIYLKKKKKGNHWHILCLWKLRLQGYFSMKCISKILPSSLNPFEMLFGACQLLLLPTPCPLRTVCVCVCQREGNRNSCRNDKGQWSSWVWYGSASSFWLCDSLGKTVTKHWTPRFHTPMLPWRHLQGLLYIPPVTHLHCHWKGGFRCVRKWRWNKVCSEV